MKLNKNPSPPTSAPLIITKINKARNKYVHLDLRVTFFLLCFQLHLTAAVIHWRHSPATTRSSVSFSIMIGKCFLSFLCRGNTEPAKWHGRRLIEVFHVPTHDFVCFVHAYFIASPFLHISPKGLTTFTENMYFQHVFGYEPPHDKTNKMTVRPAKAQISLGIRPVWSEPSLCAQWVAKDPNFLHADSEDSLSDWADAQADLSSLGAQSFCRFCHETARMIL